MGPWKPIQHGGLVFSGVGDEGLRIIDFISRPGWFFKDYISELNNREYTGNDYLPHDAAVKSFETGLTRLETLTKAGRKPVHVPLAKVEDRIHAAQLVLPKCRFNSTRCEQGLAALREYRRDWDDNGVASKDETGVRAAEATVQTAEFNELR
jgi:phage terminase large subunit